MRIQTRGLNLQATINVRIQHQDGSSSNAWRLGGKEQFVCVSIFLKSSRIVDFPFRFSIIMDFVVTRLVLHHRRVSSVSETHSNNIRKSSISLDLGSQLPTKHKLELFTTSQSLPLSFQTYNPDETGFLYVPCKTHTTTAPIIPKFPSRHKNYRYTRP